MASTDYNWTQAAMAQPPMSEQEIGLRNLFVNEYLIDYDSVAAAMRCGFQSSFAEDYARKFMGEPYVQQRLKNYRLAEPESKETKATEDEFNKRRIMTGLMREAHNGSNSGAARVAAFSKLSSIYGMDAPIKTQQEVLHRGGVMMVPAIADINAWEMTAIESQSKLVTEARSDA